MVYGNSHWRSLNCEIGCQRDGHVILIVDDLEESRDILSRLLQREGYRTRCAQTGVHGLGAVEEYGPDLIILDEMMPGMTGLEMLKWLRQAGVTTPVVFF